MAGGGMRPFSGSPQLSYEQSRGIAPGPVTGPYGLPLDTADKWGVNRGMSDPAAPGALPEAAAALSSSEFEQMGAPTAAIDKGAKGPDGSGGIGLMGTLGIINAGAGLGGQIFKMISASSQKPKKRYRAVGGPSGGYF